MDDAHDWQALCPAGLSRRWTPPRHGLFGLLDGAARRHAARVAVSFEGRDRTFEDLRDEALLWAAAILGAGAAATPPSPDRVAIVLPNCPAFLTSFQGAVAAGLVATTWSPHLTAAEYVPLLADSEPAVVVTTQELADTLRRAIRDSGSGARVLLAAPGSDTPPGRRRARAVEPHPSATAVLQYTSGTTGGTKAAEMTHANLVANAWQNDLWFGWTGDDVILGALPLCHTWGMSCVMHAAFAAGARIALVREFDAAAVLRTIAEERVTVAYGSATMFHRLLDAAGAGASDAFAPLRYVKAGAMLVGSDLSARWSAAVPGVPMINGYGLTEASPEVCNNPPHARRTGTVGVPLPGTELRLCDPSDPRRVCARGEEGEIQVRGPQVMRGYWRRPDATAATLLPDGWLRTGDLAAFDEAGYVVIRDRLKDLIKFRGWSVVPGEVEKALREHPAVEEACVVGAPDPRDGEVPVAFLVRRSGAALPSESEWRVHLDVRLARIKHPRRFVEIAEIPKNHVGKPLRRTLRERASRPDRA